MHLYDSTLLSLLYKINRIYEESIIHDSPPHPALVLICCLSFFSSEVLVLLLLVVQTTIDTGMLVRAVMYSYSVYDIKNASLSSKMPTFLSAIRDN